LNKLLKIQKIKKKKKSGIRSTFFGEEMTFSLLLLLLALLTLFTPSLTLGFFPLLFFYDLFILIVFFVLFFFSIQLFFFFSFLKHRGSQQLQCLTAVGEKVNIIKDSQCQLLESSSPWSYPEHAPWGWIELGLQSCCHSKSLNLTSLSQTINLNHKSTGIFYFILLIF